MQYTLRMRQWSPVISALLVFLPRLLVAQASQSWTGSSPAALKDKTALEIVPSFGLYVPFGTLKRGDRTQGETTIRQIGGGMVGLRMSWHGVGVLGLDASVSYSPTLVAVTDASKTVDLAGRVALFSLRARIGLNPPMLRGLWSFYLGSGVGAVHRHGGAWNGAGGTSDLALTLGGGARLAGKRFAFNIDLEDYITRPGFTSSGSDANHNRLHQDQVLSFGIGIPIGTR